LLLLVSERSFKMLAARTNRIIVYNVPRHSAVDLVNVGSCTFIGDDTCRNDAFIRNFYIDPSRLVYRLDPSRNLTTLEKLPPFIYFSGKKLLMLNNAVSLPHFAGSLKVDIVILSQNAPFTIARLHEQLDCPQYVFDASNASWKIREWKNECDSLHLRRHSVQDDGAFVLDF
jgi:competence protein ComEC